jgi:amino acid transporter
LFLIIQIVSIGTLPDLAKSERPLADAAAGFMGNFGAGFIAVGALISVLGNLNGGFLAASRLPFAMAEQNELPQALAKTHPQFKTPTLSILITAVLVLLLTIQSSFLTAVAIATITRLLVYASTCLALPFFRRRTNIPNAEYKAPYGIMASILSLALIVWLMVNVDYKKEGLAIAIAVVIGLVLYFAYRFFGKKSDEVSAI